MAGESVDDIYVIVLFTSFVQIAQTRSISLTSFLFLPLCIFLGILVGILSGILFVKLFKKYHIRDTSKVLIILSFSLFFLVFENTFSKYVSYSGLLSTLAMGITILAKYEILTLRLVKSMRKFGCLVKYYYLYLWAVVDITTIPNIVVMAVILILGALVFRSIGVLISLLKTDLNKKEKLFVVEAYLPKETVQASIASIPLSLGISKGNTMLTVAVLAILIWAPLGAILIDLTKKQLLRTPDFYNTNVLFN